MSKSIKLYSIRLTKQFIITASVVLFCIGCSSNKVIAQVPDWYLQGSSTQYPTSLYIVGIGEGRSAEDAAIQARGSVGAQIRVQVESEMSSIIREFDIDGRNTLETEFLSNTTQTIDEQLLGLDISLRGEHAGRYYALAALNRERYLEERRSELERLKDQYNAFLSNAREQVSAGQIFTAVTSFLDAQETASDFYAAMSVYNALSHTSYGSGDVLGVAGIIPEIRTILSELSISVVSGSGQTASAGRELPEPVVFMVTYGRDTPVPGVPIRVEYQDGTLADRVTTERDGQASVTLTAIPVRRQTNQIVARPLFRDLPAIYQNQVRNLTVRANYEIKEEPAVPVAILIYDEQGNRLGQVEQRLSGTIERMGFTLNPASQFAIEGTLSLAETREVTGTGGRQTVVRTEILAQVRDRAPGGSVLGTFSGEGTGMSNRGEREAIRASHNRININRRVLSEALSAIPSDAGTLDIPLSQLERRPDNIPPAGPAGSAAGEHSIEIDNLRLVLQSASKTQDNRVVVELTVTNVGQREQELLFSRRNTVMFDQLGQETASPVLTVADSRAESGSGVRHLLQTDKPTKVIIEFRGVHPQASAISLLRLSAGNSSMELRDISLD